MYHNFIFDLYGTLVDIHTNENKTSLWKKACAVLFLPGCFLYGEGTEEQISPAGNGCQQGSLILHLSGDLRRRYFSNSLCRKISPTHRGSSDRYRSVLPDRIPQYFTMLSRHDRHTAAAPCKRLWALPPVQCPADLHRIRAALAGTLGSVRRYPYLL